MREEDIRLYGKVKTSSEEGFQKAFPEGTSKLVRDFSPSVTFGDSSLIRGSLSYPSGEVKTFSEEVFTVDIT
ncbi:MAG: hypothetical protein IJ945_03085, partial [Oscillospiraceae bacterium]|nr:hypothetical protein [Oscillospiraceae bacterium]